MTDRDKMARELLARQYDCDLPGSGVAKKLRGEFEGQLRVADLIGLAAIRAAGVDAGAGGSRRRHAGGCAPRAVLWPP